MKSVVTKELYIPKKFAVLLIGCWLRLPMGESKYAVSESVLSLLFQRDPCILYKDVRGNIQFLF